MKFLCLIFRHKFDPRQYARINPCGIDGMGREHAFITATCDRCETRFRLCNIHLCERDVEAQLRGDATVLGLIRKHKMHVEPSHRGDGSWWEAFCMKSQPQHHRGPNIGEAVRKAAAHIEDGQ